MNRLCKLLFVLHCLRCSAAHMTTTVELGDNVTLHCSLTHSDETVWVGQRCNQIPFLIISAEVKYGKLLHRSVTSQSKSFLPQLNVENNSVSLIILNISESGLGLYYCVAWSESIKQFGLGSLLVTGPLKERSDNGPGCHALLAVVCPVCAVVTVLLLTASLCFLFHQKGLCGFRCKGRAEKELSNDELQEENDGLNYITLSCSTRCNQPNTTWTENEFVTYSAASYTC